MSRVTMRHATKAQPDLADLATLGPRLLLLSMDSARDFVARAADTIGPTVPNVSRLRSQIAPDDCCCQIPETDCPPRCVCHVTWEGNPGEVFHASVRVRNSGKVARTFNLAGTEFSGAAQGAIEVKPASMLLAPGQSAVAEATYTVPAGTPAGTYTSEITINGAYEQAVCVTLTVQPPGTVTCEVVQGEIPRRVRAMHWYRHFQCDEPCEPPSRPTPTPGTNVPSTPAGTVPGAAPTSVNRPPG
jgi:hypothetical protein